MNGKPGDDPVLDAKFGRPAYSQHADALIRKLLELGAEAEVRILIERQFAITKLERELENLFAEFRLKRINEGWEVE